MARTKHTVKLDDGRTEQRVSESRAYTHAIVVEHTPAEKAANIKAAEVRLSEAKAEAERLAPLGSTKKAKAEYALILEHDAYWHEQVSDEDGTTRDRWLTLSKYTSDIETQDGLDAHYTRVREHLAHIPEGLDSDGRDVRALVGSTPTVLGLKAEEGDYRGDWRRRRVFVDGLGLSGLVSNLKYSHVVHKLADARNKLLAAEKALAHAREAAIGAESQYVAGWAQSKRNADNRVAAERAKRPLARVFHRESTVAAPGASRKRG